MGLLYELAEAIVGFMEEGPSLPAVLFYLAVAAVPVTLLHELGHAVVARQRLGGEVEVSVGSAGKLADLRLGQIRASINAVDLPRRASGLASFDDSLASARDVAWIAFTGPLASLAEIVVTVVLLAVTPDSGVLHGVLWAAMLGGLGGVLNLIPFEFQDRPDGPRLRSDGRLALDALRMARALR